MKKPWTDQEKETLRKLYPDSCTADLAIQLGRTVNQIYNQVYILGLKKSAAYLASPIARRLRRGDEVGKRNRFPKGNCPWNKGMKGLDIGGKATRFKSRQMPHNHVPVGTVVTVDGYLKIKVAEPKTWRWLHRKTWEDANGPIPKGLILAFKDRNRANCALENLELITRKQNMARNTVHNWPEELKKIIQLRAGLVRRINDKERRNEQ